MVHRLIATLTGAEPCHRLRWASTCRCPLPHRSPSLLADGTFLSYSFLPFSSTRFDKKAKRIFKKTAARFFRTAEKANAKKAPCSAKKQAAALPFRGLQGLLRLRVGGALRIYLLHTALHRPAVGGHQAVNLLPLRTGGIGLQRLQYTDVDQRLLPQEASAAPDSPEM